MKHYRLVLINTKTGKRTMMTVLYRSRKSAEEVGKNFCKQVKDADYEIIEK